jgi:AcrR family transcriptional regulator
LIAKEVKARTGRRPGAESSRTEILSAAKTLFARDGYDGATIRAIANEAGVDNALVIHFFTSKERLFAAVLEDLSTVLPTLGAKAAAGDRSERGRLLAQTYFELWESGETGEALRALIRGAIGSPNATAIMREFLETQLIAPMSNSPMAMVSGMLLGVAITRYVVEAGPLADMSLLQVVDSLAPSLQVQLDTL